MKLNHTEVFRAARQGRPFVRSVEQSSSCFMLLLNAIGLSHPGICDCQIELKDLDFKDNQCAAKGDKVG